MLSAPKCYPGTCYAGINTNMPGMLAIPAAEICDRPIYRTIRQIRSRRISIKWLVVGSCVEFRNNNTEDGVQSTPASSFWPNRLLIETKLLRSLGQNNSSGTNLRLLYHTRHKPGVRPAIRKQIAWQPGRLRQQHHTTRENPFRLSSAGRPFSGLRPLHHPYPDAPSLQTTAQHLVFLSFFSCPMASTTLFRIASRTARPASFARASYASRSALAARSTLGSANSFSTSSKRLSAGHEEETYEEFSAR